MVCWVCETLCSYICWFDNLMLRWNRSMLYTYMCWFDCNLAIFIKLDSGIGPNLLTWHPIISWSNSDDKKFCIKISNWAIAQDRIKQLPGPRSFIRFCWNRKFNFNVGTHMNVNLLELCNPKNFFRGYCNSFGIMTGRNIDGLLGSSSNQNLHLSNLGDSLVTE